MARPDNRNDEQARAALKARLTVINGGRALGQAAPMPMPAAPILGPEELAVEMAEIFAMSLLRDLPLGALGAPHGRVQIDGPTSFTLHELLCELRNLPRCHAGADGVTAETTASSRAGLGDSGHRQALRLNGDGQLTLGTLFRSGVVLPGDSAVLSDLWRDDHAVAQPDPSETCPADDAPMSDWVNWCATQTGAGLRLPGQETVSARVETLGMMADALHDLPAARPFHNAALAALARGRPASGLSGPRLFALMQKAEARARHLAMQQAARLDRLTRPAVTAARMSVWLAREERDTPRAAPYREAAEILAEASPRLLEWVGRANAARRGRVAPGPSLFLPLAGADALRTSPSDCIAHLIVAGALATVLKAAFDPGQGGRLRMVGAIREGTPIGEGLDRLVSNIALSRVASGGYFPAENMQDMRLGQTIGLQVLREALAEDNRSADMSLRDFDGRDMHMIAHPRAFGPGHVDLRAGGQITPWPLQRASVPHLTRVV